jgi:3-phenylpropionate/trans-cinnamate dioxygenase ferredoxin subunit
MADFVTVGKVDEVPPGERLVAQIGRHWVVVFNVGGTLYAVEDQCSHEDYPLSEGTLDGMEIECAKHGARFDIRTGKNLTPPALLPVRWYEVRIEGDEIQVARQ